MKILTNRNDIIVGMSENIVYAKPGASDGGYQVCEQLDATHYWDRDEDVVYMANFGIRMFEVETVPAGVSTRTHKYIDGEFVENEDYIPYIPDKERIEALEDMVNILLGV